MSNSSLTTNGTSRSFDTRKFFTLGAALIAGFFVQSAQAFPVLNLTPGTPDIKSESITVDYQGDNAGGVLSASGIAEVFTPPGSPAGNITDGTFDIFANINFNTQTANGTLNIGGTLAGFGFNSGTLLTGNFLSTAGNQTFGAGAGDPLEFLFSVTGGDAADLYGGIGSTAGIILSQSGYTGSFDGDFSSGPSWALADTFVQSQPPPAIGGAVTGVVVKTIDCNNKTTHQKVSITVNGSTTIWDCEAAGLIVSPGDKIDMKIKGNAN
jgi:hypothetical protein